MADINPTPQVSPDQRNTSGQPNACTNSDAEGQVTEAEAIGFVELLFFAYRDFTSEADDTLHDFGFGRAHHRVLHFVHRNPGLRVADLLEILKITKQSLARVLKQLIQDGFITQEPGLTDRRERHLYVTERGDMLAQRLLIPQVKRIGEALSAAGPGAEVQIAKFLTAIISMEDQEKVAKLIDRLPT